MAEFVRVSIAEQIGLGGNDPVQVLDLPVFLVSGASDQAPNTVVPVAGGYACWVAPNRRVVVGTVPEGGFVSEVTDGTAVFAFADEDFLALGCTLPAEALSAGRCAQTLFAGVKALIYRHDGAIRLHVSRPLAPFLRDWLRTAASTRQDSL